MIKSNFIVRTGTALLSFGVFFLTWFFIPRWGLPLLVSLVVLGLCYEYFRLIFYPQAFSVLRLLLLGLCFGAYCFWAFFLRLEDRLFLLILPPVLFFASAFWLLYFFGLKDIAEKLSLSVLSLFYIAFPSALFLTAFSRGFEAQSFLFLMALCCGDIFAYLGGSFFKGKKWTPRISPKKTYAGLFCGLLAAGLSSGFGFYLSFGLSFFLFFLFGVLAFFIAQTGDLFISLLKRRAGLKNTGCFLPGHGGLLDRLDGVLPAFCFLCLLLRFF